MEWCDAWPQERKDAELRLYRAQCKLRCLKANLDRIDLDQFEVLMEQIEATQMEIQAAATARIRAAANFEREAHSPHS